jgi:hypothetical protein
MSQMLSAAQQRAWNLATTLMVCVTLIQTEGGFGVMPTSEFDGDIDTVIHDYDPFEIMCSRK